MSRRRRLLLAIVLVLGVGPLLIPVTSGGASIESRAYENSSFIELRGVRTHVQTWEPTGTPIATVVASHHFYGSAQTFDRVGQLLAADGVRLVAFDRVGFGLTQRVNPGGKYLGPDAPYTRDFAAEQIRELLDHLGIERAIIAGTSMGGTTSIQFALAHPDRVQHLVPIAAALTGDASAPPAIRPLARMRWMHGIGAFFVRRIAPGAASFERVTNSWKDPSRATEGDVEAHLGRFIGVEGWDAGLWWKLMSDAKPDLVKELPRLAELGVPVTTVGGTADPIISTQVVELTAERAGGIPALLDCGHVVQQECPEGLARILLGIAHGA